MTALAIERKTCFCRLRGCFRHARQLNPYPSTAAAAFPAARLLVVLDLPSVAAQPDDPVPLDVFAFFSTQANDRRPCRDTCLRTYPRLRSRAPKNRKRTCQRLLNTHLVYARCRHTYHDLFINSHYRSR
jgi:hypothetical protein